MEFSKEELAQAKVQIDSTLHKLRRAIKTMEAKAEPGRYRPQLTLAKRRVRAFEIAARLVEREMEDGPSREF